MESEIQPVKEVFLNNRWVRDVYFLHFKDSNETGYCLLGAVALTKGYENYGMKDFQDLPCTQYIIEAIKIHFKEDFDQALFDEEEEIVLYSFNDPGIITVFNDHIAQSLDDIMLVLDEAIYLEKEAKALEEMKQKGGS